MFRPPASQLNPYFPYQPRATNVPLRPLTALQLDPYQMNMGLEQRNISRWGGADSKERKFIDLTASPKNKKILTPSAKRKHRAEMMKAKFAKMTPSQKEAHKKKQKEYAQRAKERKKGLLSPFARKSAKAAKAKPKSKSKSGSLRRKMASDVRKHALVMRVPTNERKLFPFERKLPSERKLPRLSIPKRISEPIAVMPIRVPSSPKVASLIKAASLVRAMSPKKISSPKVASLMRAMSPKAKVKSKSKSKSVSKPKDAMYYKAQLDECRKEQNEADAAYTKLQDEKDKVEQDGVKEREKMMKKFQKPLATITRQITALNNLAFPKQKSKTSSKQKPKSKSKSKSKSK